MATAGHGAGKRCRRARARMSSLRDNPLVAHAALFLESLDFSCPLATIYENTHLARACGN